MNSIGDNCRSILRQRYLQNPLCSPYGLKDLCLPLRSCEQPSCPTTLFGLSDHPRRKSLNIDGHIAPMQMLFNGQYQCLSTATDQCIQMISETILNRIQCDIPGEELALLCVCLPSFVREIMCKSPWLTPNDIIQWLTCDILVKSSLWSDEKGTK